jgi:hypothetical protein
MEAGEFADKPLGIRGLLGVGLDGRDGHTRYTKGKQFVLVGGSRETHERMQETAVRFTECVKDRGKPLERITGRELGEIAAEVREKTD